MNNAFSSSNFAKELAELQKKMEDARRKAFDSMREVLALRNYGGAASGTDEEDVVYVSLDDQGSPLEIRVAQDWADFYTAEELSGLITVVAKQLENERNERATAYLNEHPEVLEEITDEQVEQAFASAHDSEQPAPSGDIEAQVLEASYSLDGLRDEVHEARAHDEAFLDDERPVSLVVVAGILIAAHVNPKFINDSTVVQLNAKLAEEIARVRDGVDAEDASLNERLRSTSAKSKSLAETLLSKFHASNS